MARYMQKPENALKRANEFIDVGKPARALDTLQEVFRNKKFTYTWSESVIEPIMFKYLDLCVELKKPHIAKEGLFQYRNMFQLFNVASLENVIRGYLRMAEKRTEAAQAQSSAAVVDIDDLDNITTPESILMSAVCGEDAQDRSDRTILLPWVKFLWESYCQCLELLKVNSHCEALYHDIARMAFQFCLKYQRKMEFRKLCDKLRKHLEDICKVSTQTANVSITKPETQQLNLDTRLYQLDSAIQMELWLEAYKAFEDIHGLMAMSKKTPAPKTMANYYQKLGMVFWKAGNQLFHAAALLKLFQLSRELKKNITPEELQKMASHVLVATLAISLPSAHPEFDRFIETDKSPLEKAQKLAVLLGLQQPPTRASLLKEMTRNNVVQLAGPRFQELYRLLEVDFNPLTLCNRVQDVIDFINVDENNPLAQYIQALQDVTLVRLVRQVSQVYQSIEFTRFLLLAKFADECYMERILVDCVRHNDMQITIDHKRKCILFGTDLSESQREDTPDGPQLQSMPSEQVRSQLVNMSVVLHRAILAINPKHKKEDRDRVRQQMVKNYHENETKEHQRILQRQKIIEDRKEYIERMNTEREEEEQRRVDELQRQVKLAEQKRLEQEMEERERKRHANEIQQIKDRSLKEKMHQISQTTAGQKLLKNLDEEQIKKLDAEQIAAKEAEEVMRERREMQTKLKSQEKKIDYFERAKRIEEIPLIEQYLADKQVQDQEFWEKQEQERIEMAIAERANAVVQQERLKKMQPDRDTFVAQLRAERNSMYVEKLKAFNVSLEEEKKKRIAQRVLDRREERRQKWLKEKEDEKQRILDEIRKVKEEEDRIRRERLDKEREAELEKLRIQTEKQRAKEEEAERKIEEEKKKVSEMTKGDNWRKDDTNEWRTRQAAADRDRDRAGESTPAKEGAWRPRFNDGGNKDSPRAAAPVAAAAAASTTAAEPEKWRRSERKEDAAGWSRRGDEKENRRGGDDREIRRGGDRDERPRGGDDRGEIRRGGDMKRADDRPRGGDREDRPRGGDREDRPRGGDSGAWRPRARDDKEIRRGGDDRDIRRGGDRDERPRGGDGEIRRGGGGGESEWRRRDEPRGGGGNESSWRAMDRKPAADDRKPAAEERKPAAAAPVATDDVERKPKPQEKVEDSEWTNVKRR